MSCPHADRKWVELQREQNAMAAKVATELHDKKKKGAKEKSGKSFGRARRLGSGVIEYPKRGYEPPPLLDGFIRDPGNAWRFIPQWPKCDKRLQTMNMKPCGAMTVLTVCNHPESEFRRQQITYQTCLACPLVMKCKSPSSASDGNSSASGATPSEAGTDVPTDQTSPTS